MVVAQSFLQHFEGSVYDVRFCGGCGHALRKLDDTYTAPVHVIERGLIVVAGKITPALLLWAF